MGGNHGKASWLDNKSAMETKILTFCPAASMPHKKLWTINIAGRLITCKQLEDISLCSKVDCSKLVQLTRVLLC